MPIPQISNSESGASVRSKLNAAIDAVNIGAPSGAAGGVLGGTYPNPTFATPAYLITPFVASALSGGAADNLDGIVTVGMSVPKVISMIIGNLLQFWQLKSSTAATATDVQRPADYATTTNEKVWFRLI